MTLQRRLEGVYRQYVARRPDVAFLTGEVVYGVRSNQIPGYIVAYTPGQWDRKFSQRTMGFEPMDQLRRDVEVLMTGEALDKPSISLHDAVAWYFAHYVAGGTWYGGPALNENTRYDKLVPWIAKTLASAEPVAAVNNVAWRLRHGLSTIADWVEATRPDVMRFTLNQVNHRAARWHAALEREALGKATEPGDIVFRFEDGWTAQKLTTREQLKCESGALVHCVGKVSSYGDRMLRGEIDIYSLRDATGVPRYTLEIGRRYRDIRSDDFDLVVAQAKGLQNKRPKKKEDCEKILVFLEHLGVTPRNEQDLEHCLKIPWKTLKRPAGGGVQRNRRTSRRRTSRRVA